MKTPDTVRRLDELPRDIAPARDLWPSIAVRIEAEAAPARPRRRALPVWLPWSITAGLALFASGAWWMTRPGDHGVDAEYRSERNRLAAQLPAVLDTLPAEARIGASQSLDAVRDAREKVLAELKRSGDDPVLREWLADTQQQEVRVMQAIVEAGARGRVL